LHTTFLNLRYTFLALLLIQPGAHAGAETFGDRINQALGLVSDEADPDQILDPDDAFRFAAVAQAPDRINLHWEIEPGYYLYRDKFAFTMEQGPAELISAAVRFPEGEIREDEEFGRVEVYTGELDLFVPVSRASMEAAAVVIGVRYQGCKEHSVCYPPMTKSVRLILPAGVASSG